MHDEDLLRRLAQLEVESVERVATLRTLAAEVPAVMSRRELTSAMLSDLRNNVDRRALAGRVGRRVIRAPKHLAKRTLDRLRGSRHA